MPAALLATPTGSGHGNMWHSVLQELRQIDGVKITTGRRADVWLASGHERPGDGRPMVVQVHEASWGEPALRQFLSPDFEHAIAGATRESVSVAAQVITPSLVARAQVIEMYGLAPETVHGVHHGVDHRIFRPGIAGGRELVGAPYVLFVGVLHPRKNYAAARQAVADLADAGAPHRLAIVGNRPPDPRWSEFASEATAELPGHPGRVIAFAALDSGQLAALMAGADAFCLPSHFEGFGLPALEALACGTPAVISDRGALPEVADGAALVVDVAPREVSTAVGRLVRDPALADRLRRAAIARASGFTWAKTAKAWLDVLRLAA